MHREDGLIELRYAKYATIDHYGVARVFASLRDIQGAYDVNFTTVSKCLQEDGHGTCSLSRDGGWLAVKALNPQVKCKGSDRAVSCRPAIPPCTDAST